MIRSKFLLLAALTITLLSSCGGNKHQLPTSNEYPVITIGAANAQMKTTYPAILKGNPRCRDSSKKFSGLITKLYIHEGEAVRAGQVLFVIDNTTYQAAVRQAEAAVASAQSGISRAQATVVQAQAALNSAQAQAATAQLTYNNSKKLI